MCLGACLALWLWNPLEASFEALVIWRLLCNLWPPLRHVPVVPPDRSGWQTIQCAEQIKQWGKAQHYKQKFNNFYFYCKLEVKVIVSHFDDILVSPKTRHRREDVSEPTAIMIWKRYLVCCALELIYSLLFFNRPYQRCFGSFLAVQSWWKLIIFLWNVIVGRLGIGLNAASAW